MRSPFEDPRRVLLVEPLLVLLRDPLSCLFGAVDIGVRTFPPLSEGIEEPLEQALSEQLNGLAAIPLDNDVCRGEVACPAIIKQLIVRCDRHHLPPEFASTLAPRLGDKIDEMLGTN